MTDGAQNGDPIDRILADNASYAAHNRPVQERLPLRRLAVICCMDARINPLNALGLKEGDAHIIRNAGGLVTADVIRTLAVSRWVLDTTHVLVLQHTHCGLHNLDQRGLETRIAEGSGGPVNTPDFLPFSDLDESVRSSVRKLANDPLFKGVVVRGGVFDVVTGLVREVV